MVSAPCFPTKFLHLWCFHCVLGLNIVPREIENNAYANVFFASEVGSCIIGNVEEHIAIVDNKNTKIKTKYLQVFDFGES